MLNSDGNIQLDTRKFYGMRPLRPRTGVTRADSPAKKRKHVEKEPVENGLSEKEEQENDKIEPSEKVKKEEEDVESYEALRQKNISEKMAFLQSLTALTELKNEMVSTKTPPKAYKKTSPQLKVKRATPPVQRRHSLRIQKKDPEGTPLPPVPVVVEERTRKPAGPLTFESVCFVDEGVEKTVEFLNNTISKTVNVPSVDNTLPRNMTKYLKDFSKMKIYPEYVAKVVPDRIFSVNLHPSEDLVLVTVGSKWGHVGFWNVNEESSIMVYQPHSKPVSCLSFDPSRPRRLITASYDGTLRCGDFERGIFDEVLVLPEDDDVGCSFFDWLSNDSLVVSCSDGSVCTVDLRTNQKIPEASYQLHPRRVRCISTHPIENSYIVTACSNGIASVWDLRNIKPRKPESLSDLHHNRSCSSAFFSPVTGNRILTASFDDRLRIFNSEKLNNVTLKSSIYHNNQTGRWLTPFKAVWLPDNEEGFVVGSMHYPRQIEVLSSEKDLLFTFKDEDLASVCSINSFHRTRPILAGGNSSGKVHVFM